MMGALCRALFMKLGLLLIALEIRQPGQKEVQIAINPGPAMIIKPNTLGFFIAQSADEVKRSVHFATIPNMGNVDKTDSRLLQCISLLQAVPRGRS